MLVKYIGKNFTMQPTFKNIIFDLGGIFLTINYQKTADAFKELGVKNFDELYAQHHASTLFENLETGKIFAADFYEQFRILSNTALLDNEIETAWNAMLGGFPIERIDWLKEIKQRYNVYLYSNTNAIHYQAFMNIYEQTIGEGNFNSHFVKAYYSHEYGFRKPYASSYNQLLQRENLIASETIFIDDTLVNIEGAAEIGLQTLHLVAPNTLLDLHW